MCVKKEKEKIFSKFWGGKQAKTETRICMVHAVAIFFFR